MLGLKPRDQSKVSHFKEVLWVWRDLLKILSWFFSWAFWQFSLKAKRYFSLSNKEKNNYYLPWSCFVQKVKHIRECRSLKQNLSRLFLLWQKWVYQDPCLSLNFCHCLMDMNFSHSHFFHISRYVSICCHINFYHSRKRPL